MPDPHWQVQDARQGFDELIRRARSDGVQFVIWDGVEVAAVLGIEEFHLLSGVGTDVKQYLLGGPRTELTITRSGCRQHVVDLSDG